MKLSLRHIYVLLVSCLVGLPATGAAQTLPTWSHTLQLGGPTADQVNQTLVDAAGNVYQTGVFTGTMQCGSITLTRDGMASYDMYLVKSDPQGNVLWARQAGSTATAAAYGAAAGNELALDAAGNVYVTGNFVGIVSFGSASTTLTTTGSGFSAFLAKYTPQGTIMWVQQGRATAGGDGSGLAVTSTGEVYLLGSFTGTLDLGNILLTSQNRSSDAFIAKFTSAGVLLWAQAVGGIYTDYGRELQLGPANSVYLSGQFVNSINLSPSIGTIGYGKSDLFVGQYDAQGTAQWVQAFGGSEDDYPGAIALTTTGELCIAGSFAGTATFGALSLTSRGGADGFLLKCTTQGAPIWAKRMGGEGDDYAYVLRQHPSGAIYVGGDFEKTADFTDRTLVSAGKSDMFLTRWDQSGTMAWAVRGGGTENDYAGGLGYGTTGPLQVGIQFVGTTQFGTLTATSRGSSDVLLCQLQDNMTLAVQPLQRVADLALYPNPVTGTSLSLSGLPTTAQDIQIVNALGQSLLKQFTVQQPIAGGRISLDISPLPTGWYALQVITAEGIISKAFSVKR